MGCAAFAVGIVTCWCWNIFCRRAGAPTTSNFVIPISFPDLSLFQFQMAIKFIKFKPKLQDFVYCKMMYINFVWKKFTASL